MQRVFVIGILIIVPIFSLVLAYGVIFGNVSPVFALIGAFITFALVSYAFLNLAKVPPSPTVTPKTKDSNADDPAAVDWLNALKDKSK